MLMQNVSYDTGNIHMHLQNGSISVRILSQAALYMAINLRTPIVTTDIIKCMDNNE